MPSTNPGRSTTILLFAVLVLPWLVRDGMFIDGICYAAISHNMSQGWGSFFHPLLSPAEPQGFYSHPPLALYLESIPFKLFGDSFLSERIYCLAMLLLNALGIGLIWRTQKDSSFKSFEWLPLFFWIIIPLVSWSFCNNILENTMAVCTTFAIYFIYLSFNKSQILWLVPAALCIIASIFSKGPPALFPLAFPFIVLLFPTHTPSKNQIAYPFVLILLCLGMFGSLYQIPELKLYLHQYINIQILPSLQDKTTVVASNDRLHIVMDLISDLLVPLIPVGLFAWFYRKEKLSLSRNRSFIIQQALIGLSATLPLMLTLKQRKFYLLPGMAFFALMLAAWILPFVATALNKLQENIAIKWNRAVYFMLTLTPLALFFLFGKDSRDHDILQDVRAIKKSIPANSIVSCSEDMYHTYSFHNYMLRYASIGLQFSNDKKYLILPKTSNLDTNDWPYTPINAPLQLYQIYQHK